MTLLCIAGGVRKSLEPYLAGCVFNFVHAELALSSISGKTQYLDIITSNSMLIIVP